MCLTTEPFCDLEHFHVFTQHATNQHHKVALDGRRRNVLGDVRRVELSRWRRTLRSRLDRYDVNHATVVIAPDVSNPSCLVDVVPHKLETRTTIDPLLNWGPVFLTDVCDQPKYGSVTERYIQVIKSSVLYMYVTLRMYISKYWDMLLNIL